MRCWVLACKVSSCLGVTSGMRIWAHIRSAIPMTTMAILLQLLQKQFLRNRLLQLLQLVQLVLEQLILEK
jgi:hypothetical protein